MRKKIFHLKTKESLQRIGIYGIIFNDVFDWPIIKYKNRLEICTRVQN